MGQCECRGACEGCLQYGPAFHGFSSDVTIFVLGFERESSLTSRKAPHCLAVRRARDRCPNDSPCRRYVNRTFYLRPRRWPTLVIDRPPENDIMPFEPQIFR